jgi:basic membrane protein A
LVTDGGSIDDNNFNGAAWAGVQQAEQELGAVIQFAVPADSNDYANKIAEFGDAGYDVIVTSTFALGEATVAAAQKYPNVDFIGVDQFQAETTEGVASLGFPEDQAGFLVGALAAMISESHFVGAVCGTDVVPPVWRYGEGYKAGVAFADSLNGTATAVFVDYHSDVDITKSFTDPEWGADIATFMIAGGADIIFGCGGETGNAAVIAAAKAGAYAIGVDVDQYYLLPDAAPRMLSSALKLITPGVFDLIKASQEGTFPSGNVLGDAGFAPFHDLDDAVSENIKVIMEKLLADITSGAIQTNVPASKP